MDNATPPESTSTPPLANWKLRALGGPRTREEFETSLRQIIAQTGRVEIRDGWIEVLDQRHHVTVSLTRPDSATPGSDFFDVNFAEQSTPIPPESVPLAETQLATCRQEFLHQLIHDLRTPLSALQLWI
jgi:signal transduction histidine kinase